MNLAARLERLETAVPSKSADVKVTIITTQEKIAEVRKRENILFESEMLIISTTDD